MRYQKQMKQKHQLREATASRNHGDFDVFEDRCPVFLPVMIIVED